MAFTQEQLEAVETAIATGELRVSFNGREVTYRSVSDLMAARRVIKDALAAAAAPVGAPTLGGRAYTLADFQRFGE